MSFGSRADQSFLGQWWWTIDRSLLIGFLVLIMIGVIMITTASPPVATRIGVDPYHFLIRHLVMLVPAMIALFAVSMLDSREIWRLGTLIFTGSIVAMIIVLFTGIEIKGAQRWIHLGPLSLQPSEFAKPAFAIVAAWMMALYKKRGSMKGYGIATGLYFLTIGLLLLQPDLGMTFVVTCIFAAQIFLAGFPFRILAAFGLIAAGGLYAAYNIFDHVHSRIDRFLDPESGDNYQVQRSIEAFQNGGIFGTGPGQGTVKDTLPDAHADFIFSVAGEEMGLIFILFLMLIYGFILLRGYNRLTENTDSFAVFAAGGLLTMFGMQALIHMGSALNMLPAKGMTLPFISYGGSSIIAMGFSMGAVLALTRKRARSAVSREGLAFRKRP
ncbi:MAG: putative lipid II flippase FtsW [Alphaproteobacteria bacterium]